MTAGKLRVVTIADEPRNLPLEELRAHLQGGVRDGVFPGCVALVWRNGCARYCEGHGQLASYAMREAAGADELAARAALSEAVASPASPRTRYDLASLTKVLATTTLTALAVQKKMLALEDEVPAPWAQACPGATLVDLLEHSAGLAAHREYFATVPGFDAAAVLEAVCRTPPAYPRRTQAVYSDLGFMILGAWLERVFDESLEACFADRVAKPLGLSADDLGFRRLREPVDAAPDRTPSDIAPTEVYLRDVHPTPPSYVPVRRVVPYARGVVHDDNAYVMGGVAGHAGLFGTAAAVLEIALAWLEPSKLGLDGALRDRFWRPSTVPGSTRRLGFDGPDPSGKGTSGNALSPRAVGHTGYTGTSLWIDPDPPGADGPFVGILLSNRVHPTRDNDRIKPFRPRFHELAVDLT